MRLVLTLALTALAPEFCNFAEGARLRRAGRDVPIGRCFQCEIGCFEDCTLKFDREILETWGFVQETESNPAASSPSTRLRELSMRPSRTSRFHDLVPGYARRFSESSSTTRGCDAQRGCAVAQDCRKDVDRNAMALSRESAEADQRRSQAAVLDTAVSHRQGVALLNGQRITPLEGTRESFFPKHPVAVGVFEKGRLKLDQCLTYCLAATCGCKLSLPGTASPKQMEKRMEENKELGTPVVDTKPTWHYREAKAHECGDGVKKVTSGLYVDFAFGVGGWLPVCTKKFWYHVFGSATSKKFGKWKQGCNDPTNMKYGCFWRGGRCVVGDRKYDHMECFTRDKLEISDMRPETGNPRPQG